MTIILCVAVIALVGFVCWVYVSLSNRMDKLEARIEATEWERMAARNK